MRRSGLVWVGLCAALVAMTPGASADDGRTAAQHVGTNWLVSLRSSGKAAQYPSVGGIVSADGRYLVFTSTDPRLLDGETVIGNQLYRRDLATGATELVSRAPDGTAANGGSTTGDISADGSRIVFTSSATNLVAGDTNGLPDVFAFDAETSEIRLVSRSPSGEVGNGASSAPAISADGQHVVFESSATNLTAAALPTYLKIFVYDMPTNRMSLVSRGAGGEPVRADCVDADISADGSRIVFESFAEELTPDTDLYGEDIFLFDRRTGVMSEITPGEHNYVPVISADGRHIAFQRRGSSLNAEPVVDGTVYNIWTYDIDADSFDLVTTAIDGGPAYPDSYAPDLSGDGRVVVFSSYAANLVAGDTNDLADVFAYDSTSGAMTLLSRGVAGRPADGGSSSARVSDDGRWVSYTSAANNLQGRDRNRVTDVFRYRLS